MEKYKNNKVELANLLNRLLLKSSTDFEKLSKKAKEVIQEPKWYGSFFTSPIILSITFLIF